MDNTSNYKYCILLCNFPAVTDPTLQYSDPTPGIYNDSVCDVRLG